MKNTPADKRPCAPYVATDLARSLDFKLLEQINKAASSILAAKTRDVKFAIKRTEADIRDLKAPPDPRDLTDEEREAKIKELLGIG